MHLYQASAESWGGTRFIATTRHSSFVTDTQGKGANPFDTLLAALCSCMGHYVREHLAARGAPQTAIRVVTVSDTARDASAIEAISVRIEVGAGPLAPEEQAEILARAERCKIYGTLRHACRVDVEVVGGEASSTLNPSAPVS